MRSGRSGVHEDSHERPRPREIPPLGTGHAHVRHEPVLHIRGKGSMVASERGEGRRVNGVHHTMALVSVVDV